ncbi:hypothetical protein BKA70DRAFT_1313827 [Coprinopsis sp. MPI-PUGE-AT-0042]|nr:hypothetical protein BKA70DRAFT_1313827 [Coprinopsis sp. MPI-PUGE-AT-0042]
MAHRRPTQLPLDLIGIIAADVASNPYERQRTRTLTQCMLVSRSFAHEFRRHLFDNLLIYDSTMEAVEDISKRLCIHAKALEDHTEYRRFVKAVRISLEVEPGLGSSILDDPQFPSWLEGLTSVTSFSLRNFSEHFDFAELDPRPRDAIIKLCSLSPIRCLTFDDVENLPPRLFCEAPNLEYLSLASVIAGGSSEEDPDNLADSDTPTSTVSRNPQIHLHIPHYSVDEEVPRMLRALAPILNRVWKLSGKYDTVEELMLLSFGLLDARDTLRELDLTLFKTYSPREINVVPIVISPAKNLERLTLTFRHSVFKPPSNDEPNLSALLHYISFMVSGIRHNDEGTLGRLSTIIIGLHAIPARCLSPEGIAKDRERWGELDDVLTKKGYLPGLGRLELKLFLRRGDSMSEETQSSAVQLLPSLAPAVRNVTISEAFY